MTRADGFSLVELVVAVGLMVGVTATIFTVVGASSGTFAAEPETADLQQRLRVASDTLFKDLVMAGAGVYSGTQAGALTYYFAPVVPSRQGAIDDDPPATFRSDTISLVYVPSTASQTTISEEMPGTSPELRVNAEPNCPQHQNLCGFQSGMSVLVFDPSGAYGVFAVASVQDAGPRLQINRAGNPTTFAAGSKVVQVSSHTYFLNTQTFQLMHADGTANPAVPVVDHVVGLTFDYYGDPQPPTLVRPLSDPVGPWTTYGPPPPALPTQIAGGGYPAGENCVFSIDPLSDLQVPRLPVLGAGGMTLVKLTSSQLTDGPWCPDGTNVNRFDADLLRIRRIGVTLRVEAAVAALRGPAGMLFVNAGTSRGGSKFVPDQQVYFEVTPRNLNLGR